VRSNLAAADLLRLLRQPSQAVSSNVRPPLLGVDQALLFVGVWSIGAIDLHFRAEPRVQHQHSAQSDSITHSATTFTPTVLPFHGGVAIVPAIHTLVVSPSCLPMARHALVLALCQ